MRWRKASRSKRSPRRMRRSKAARSWAMWWWRWRGRRFLPLPLHSAGEGTQSASAGNLQGLGFPRCRQPSSAADPEATAPNPPSYILVYTQCAYMSTGFLLSRVPALGAGAGERADAVLILGQLGGG